MRVGYNFKGVVSWCPLFRGNSVLGKRRWEHGFCPLSGIEKRPLLGGCLSITTMVISIRNTDSVRFWEVVRFSEGPLSEVRLYMYIAVIFLCIIQVWVKFKVKRKRLQTDNDFMYL